jgi:hypothetical protein
MVLVEAIKRGASDIHIEPYEKSFRVRYRIDGVLYEILNPPMKLRNAIISRVKIMSNMDIAERRLPQDGRIKIKLGGGREMDFRVSVMPTLFGEKIVLRLLDKSNLQLDMTKLGFEEACARQIQGRHPQTVRHGAGHRADGFRQDDDALLGPLGAQQDEREHLHGRGSGRVQPARHQSVPDERLHRPELRRSPPVFPPAGPGHHHGR